MLKDLNLEHFYYIKKMLFTPINSSHEDTNLKDDERKYPDVNTHFESDIDKDIVDFLWNSNLMTPPRVTNTTVEDNGEDVTSKKRGKRAYKSATPRKKMKGKNILNELYQTPSREFNFQNDVPVGITKLDINENKRRPIKINSSVADYINNANKNSSSLEQYGTSTNVVNFNFNIYLNDNKAGDISKNISTDCKKFRKLVDFIDKEFGNNES